MQAEAMHRLRQAEALPNVTFSAHEDFPNASLLEESQMAEELITSKDGATTGKCCSCRGEPRIKTTCGKGCTTCRGCCHGMSLAQVETPPMQAEALPSPLPVASLLEDPGTAAEPRPNVTFSANEDFPTASLLEGWQTTEEL